MNRKSFLGLLGGAPVLAALAFQSKAGVNAGVTSAAGEFEEMTIAEMHSGMVAGRLTALSLAKAYLKRIEAVDRNGPKLNSVIELNPDALAIARDLDREWKRKGPRSPMHGIPILLKDNIDTHDKMSTTAGSLALKGHVAARDAFVVEKLRAAGAVILGKTNLSEWANFRSTRSTSGWSGRGGLTLNPYALDRNPSGSSSGSAVAVSANLCAVAVGTETNGSIISPSSVCGVVGIKPTVGLISRSGIIPISHTQDTSGPMARTVTDAAILLGAMTGLDSTDAATHSSEGKAYTDYTRFLDRDGLRGVRIGVLRRYFKTHSKATRIANEALVRLKDLGATLIDPADLPSDEKVGDAGFELMLFEFKAGLNAYLANLPSDAPVRSLTDLIAFNERHQEKELPFFGQEILAMAEGKGSLTDKVYLDALALCRRVSREGGIDKIMDTHRLEAIVAPASGPAGATDLVYGDRDLGGCASPAAVAGYPSLTVPAGFVSGLPVGLCFFGRAYSEPVLIRLAFAFEQATRMRRAPGFASTVSDVHR